MIAVMAVMWALVLGLIMAIDVDGVLLAVRLMRIDSHWLLRSDTARALVEYDRPRLRVIDGGLSRVAS